MFMSRWSGVVMSPECCASYVRKRQQTFHECCIEHAWSDKYSAFRAHINQCDGIKHMKNLMFLNTSVDGDITTPDHHNININIVKNNVQIIDSHSNWNVFFVQRGNQNQRTETIIKYWFESLKIIRSLLTLNFLIEHI